MSEAEEKREWVRVAARYEERLTVALAENERLRAALRRIGELIAHEWPGECDQVIAEALNQQSLTETK